MSDGFLGEDNLHYGVGCPLYLVYRLSSLLGLSVVHTLWVPNVYMYASIVLAVVKIKGSFTIVNISPIVQRILILGLPY